MFFLSRDSDVKKHTRLVWNSKYVETYKVSKNTSLSVRRVKAALKHNTQIIFLGRFTT